MTKQPCKYFAERPASLPLNQYHDKLLGLRSVKSCAILAVLTLSIASSGLGQTSGKKAEQSPAKPAKEQPQAATGQRPTQVELESWRRTILHSPRPKKACYKATFPQPEWQEVACNTPPSKLYPPKRGGIIRPEIVGGGGPDFTADAAHISEAEGSFDSVTGVTTECTVACPAGVCPANPTCTISTNLYSLQLNTEPFTDTAAPSPCSTSPAPATCQEWEQFVYDTAGSGFIQYWLITYGPAGTSCPAPHPASCAAGVATDGWCPFQFTPTDPVFCVVNAASGAPAPSEPITSLGELKVTGTAAGVHGATDGIAITVTPTMGPAQVFSAPGNNYFPHLENLWQDAEFNVFGDGGGDQAVFNSGSTLVVRTAVDTGLSTGPGCGSVSFTGESNNLTLVNSLPVASPGSLPSLVFSESNPPPAGGAATCADALSLGDTHLTTFDGLYYDFQASGDFVLAQDGPDFIVQGRQASGAPTWPNAAVNKAVATQMGKTRVAVYIEPTRLVIDGAATDLADGKSILLPTGVQVTRHGNLYSISDLSGDRVRATLNSTWINVTVGLGLSPRPLVHGLLGNPLGNALELVTSNGVALRAPVLFQDLYHTYAESWRVNPKESLFTEETRIRFGIPTKPFYAADLTRQQAAHALAACKAAGIKNAAFLDSCTLDTAVLNDEAAVKAFVHLPPPRHVIQPGSHRKDHDRDEDCDCDRERDRDRDHDRDHEHH
jgi:hypothetical protein